MPHPSATTVELSPEQLDALASQVLDRLIHAIRTNANGDADRLISVLTRRLSAAQDARRAVR